MKYKRNVVMSNLYEVSKSQNDGALLPATANKYNVYSVDKVKDEFCRMYRHDAKLRSCDAYYFDRYNHLVIEFKNTHHLNLKEYYDEIEIKIMDTHMILGETFCRNKKSMDLGKRLKMLVVYNDALNHGDGVCHIRDMLNTVTPKRGDNTRNIKIAKVFKDEAEFLEAVSATKNKYGKQFYNEIDFIEKKEFEKIYVEANYFDNLEEWAEMCD